MEIRALYREVMRNRWQKIHKITSQSTENLVATHLWSITFLLFTQQKSCWGIGQTVIKIFQSMTSEVNLKSWTLLVEDKCKNWWKFIHTHTNTHTHTHTHTHTEFLPRVNNNQMFKIAGNASVMPIILIINTTNWAPTVCHLNHMH